MNVLIINSYYFPDVVGGAERSTQLIAEELLNRGHNVLVFCLRNSIDSIVNGVKVYRSNPGRFNVKLRLKEEGNFFQKLMNKIIETNNKAIDKEILKVINEFKPDVAHVNSLYGLSGRIWKILNQQKIKVVQTVRDYWFFDGFNHKSNNFIFKLYHKHYFKKYAKYVDYVTAPSKATLDIAKKSKFFRNAKFYYINNGVRFNIDEVKKIIHEKKKYDGDLVCVYAGALTERKGIKQLISAFNDLNDDSFKLKICGSGELKDYVVYSCKNNPNMEYLGQLDRERLFEVYKKSNISIVPSLWIEPFGMVVVEAMINGCIVVGSEYGGIHEILDNISGVEIDPNSKDEIIAGIKSLKNIEKRTDILDIVEERISMYEINNTINKYVKLYNE